ncbi:MAG TPA: CocE/NonD family hydrolase [Solirubrobacter sp.]|nr:CocE/NonD family hydrolase [Solirubrobacter sp.]
MRRGLAAGVLAALFLGAGAAQAAADPVITVGADGKTAPVFSYQDAKRERVWVPVANVDQDNNGVTDRVAIDIIRPKESGPSLKVPAIIDDSPYYTSLGRGNETQYIHTTADGVLDKFPLFYDNYFVPRGYAIVLAHAIGTGFSTGCPLHGGPGDVAGFKAVVDWLMGRIDGYTSIDGTTTVHNDWNNGKNAMIGKSYDGTFANGVAATGVDGLTTIVPVSGISSWYDYSRMGGIRENTHYPRSLDNSITGVVSQTLLGVLPPDHRTPCASVINGLNDVDGDSTGDINPFWNDRDYRNDVSKVKAAVFASHGINDDNVRPDQIAEWWTGLAANNVPRKLWLSQEGHVDPFEYRRAEWVDTLHRWFDYWLQGVQNGIMDEPRVDIEQPQGNVWKTYADFPIPGTVNTDVYLSGRAAGQSGSLGLSAGGGTDSLTFTDNSLSETNAINSPNGSQANRLVFLSPKLKSDVHVSGTPIIDLQAALSTTQSNLAALLVDYGASSRVGRAGSDGVTTGTTRTCWGESSTATDGSTLDSACYLEVTKPVQNVTQWRVSKGILDSSNRTSLFDGQASPVVPGDNYEFKFRILPTDYTFPAGHQIGVILLANYSMGVAGTRGAQITVDTKTSKVSLPITGGADAATASGGFVADTTAPVITAPDVNVYTSDLNGTTVSFSPSASDTQDPSPALTCDKTSGSTFPIGATTVNCTATDANGNATSKSFVITVAYSASAPGDVNGTVPATLALTLGAPASFGAFTPGVAQTYTASTVATVTSSAGDATLSVDDPSADHPGHLVNGAFALPSALGGLGVVKTYDGPVSNDAATVTFTQAIGASDALRTGAYSKTLTFTLSTTNP